MKISTLGFLAIVFGLPLGQAAIELSSGGDVQALEVFGPFEERRLRAFEDDLHDASIVTRNAVPVLQEGLARWLRRGNEKVFVGDDGWLFYVDDVEFVTGPGLLTPAVGGRRALETIVAFRDALAERDVELLVVPVPTKAVVEPARLASDLGAARPDNRDAAAFRAALTSADVAFVDLRAVYEELRATASDLYLARDTHWTPATMRAVAERIATRVNELVRDPAGDGERFTTMPFAVEGRGDTLAMLGLRDPRELFGTADVTVERVVDAASGDDWTSDRQSDVLILGDSFTQVFSDGHLGLGSGAGLAEHVSLALGRPVDVIAMAGGGALGPREALAHRTDGLAGKRVVVWEFTERELVAGDDRWAWVDLPERTSPAAAGPTDEPPVATDDQLVVAEVVERSEIDRDFEYDFCLGIFVYELLAPSSLGEAGARLSVAYPIVTDWEDTPESRFEPGDRHRLRLDPISEHYDLEETCWVDDADAPPPIYFATSWEDVD